VGYPGARDFWKLRVLQRLRGQRQREQGRHLLVRRFGVVRDLVDRAGIGVARNSMAASCTRAMPSW
jgi:hypothetical protein